MAVARDGEEEALGGVVEREGSGAQLEESAQLRARHLRAAYIDALDPAGGVVYRRAQPEGGVLPELGLGVGGEHRLAEVLRGDGDGADVVWHVVRRLRALDAHEIGLGLPNGRGVLRPPRGGGVEDGLDHLAAVAHVLPVRGADGGEDLLHVRIIVPAPVFAQGLVRRVGLAAAGVVADVGLRVGRFFAAHGVHDVGPGGHGLGLQRLRLEGGGHLPGHHAGQPVRHGDGFDLPLRQDGEGQLRIELPCSLRFPLRLRLSLSPARKQQGQQQREHDAQQRRRDYRSHPRPPFVVDLGRAKG